MNAVEPKPGHEPTKPRRRKAFRGAVAIVLGCVLVGALLTAGPASAASRGFKLTNKSSSDLQLVTAKSVPTVKCIQIALCVGTHNPMEFEGRPTDGSTLKAGGTDVWELKYGFSFTGGVQYAANLWYKVAGTDAEVNYKIETYTTSNDSSCQVVGTTQYSCVAQGTKLEFK